MKRYQWEQDQIAHMKVALCPPATMLHERFCCSSDGIAIGVWSSQEYIARFGHGSAKLARQAQSKEKTLSKMVEGGCEHEP